VFALTTGVILATATAEPLLRVFVVTTAVSSPAVAGLVEKVTVNEVAVAAVTVPTALLSNVTVLLLAVLSNPKPLMVTVLALAANRLEELSVTTGMTVATSTAAPLLSESVDTTAVSDPAAVGFVENLTVKVVEVAAVTLPTAPLVNVTKLSPADVSKPKPWIVTVLAFAARFVVLLVTTGM
jgi:hypothetical protein